MSICHFTPHQTLVHLRRGPLRGMSLLQDEKPGRREPQGIYLYKW